MSNNNNTANINTNFSFNTFLKEIIKIYITEYKYNNKINNINIYKLNIKHVCSKAAKQLNIKEKGISQNYSNFLISFTIRGFLYPKNVAQIIIELIQLLEFSYTTSLFDINNNQNTIVNGQ